MSATRRRGIVALELDQKSIVRWSPEVEHERNVAIFDLLEEQPFPARSTVRRPLPRSALLRESNLVLARRSGTAGGAASRWCSPLAPFRGVIKDYFLICDSYFQAIKGATPSRIEAIDMARRGLHNEGSEILRERARGRVEIDHDTARRLFTLVCVLHIRG